MPAVRFELERYRQQAQSGALQPRGPVLVEAQGENKEPLRVRAEDGTPRPWTTQRIQMRALEQAAAKRVERMMALQNRVSDESHVFAVEKGEHNDSPNICIGRARRNDIVIDADTVSSQHAIIEEGEGRHILRDNGSSNGTLVNDKQLSPTEQVVLRSGDCIDFGGLRFFYLNGGQFSLFLKLRLQCEEI